MKVEMVRYILHVQDMERAIAFYRDVIGLAVNFKSDAWSEMPIAGANVALHGGGDGEFNDTGLSFQVEDIDLACTEIANGGGRVLSGPADRPGEPIRLASLVDTEGNGFSINQCVA